MCVARARAHRGHPDEQTRLRVAKDKSRRRGEGKAGDESQSSPGGTRVGTCHAPMMTRARTCALQFLALLVGTLVAVDAMVAELREFQQLQNVRRLVDLAAKVAILEVQEEYFSPRSVAESVARFGLKMRTAGSASEVSRFAARNDKCSRVMLARRIVFPLFLLLLN